jgi:hypothetical protein
MDKSPSPTMGVSGPAAVRTGNSSDAVNPGARGR